MADFCLSQKRRETKHSEAECYPGLSLQSVSDHASLACCCWLRSWLQGYRNTSAWSSVLLSGDQAKCSALRVLMRQKLSTHKAEPKCCHKLLSFPHHSAPSSKPANKVCYFSSLHPHPIDKHAAWYLFCTSSSGLITIMTRQPPVHLQISLLL